VQPAKFRAPANVQLRRAQLILLLAAVVPTGLASAVGVILLAFGTGSRTVSIVAGVLVLAFCTSAITGYILGSIFLKRGASLARVQNDFLTSVSHELRTPLTSMRMFVETLGGDAVIEDAERQRCLDLLQREMTRLDGLVSRLIDLSKIETGSRMIKRDPVRVADVVADALVGLEAAALGAEVSVTADVDDGLVVLGDRSALAQALVNLLVNAHKYSEGDPRIELVACERAKDIEISVTDHGPGIPRAEQKTIFDKFTRGSQALETGKHGSGLGLSIVQAIVAAHKGRLTLKSDSRSGSRFSILLPRVS
jgi:two-component system phosphate regulon sensor histidine kinase PhoR